MVRHRHRQQETWESPSTSVPAGDRASRPAVVKETVKEVTGTMKVIAPGSVSEALGPAGPGSLHTSPELMAAQFLNWAEMIPGAVSVAHSFSAGNQLPLEISRDRFESEKEQEGEGVALRTDRLAREAERARSQEERCKNRRKIRRKLC
uniref:Uncharacterized protein n=1 Tax=Pipistrellus kuhlii TaxID=59472 RepID=A0A7J7VMN1_PIPKU|nr:hypothetical protein mPipKuh1_008439 [Pipistrellus kuhlii]